MFRVTLNIPGVINSQDKNNVNNNWKKTYWVHPLASLPMTSWKNLTQSEQVSHTYNQKYVKYRRVICWVNIAGKQTWHSTFTSKIHLHDFNLHDGYMTLGNGHKGIKGTVGSKPWHLWLQQFTVLNKGNNNYCFLW